MRAVQDIKHNMVDSTACNDMRTYVTSAINTDTENYICIKNIQTSEVELEDPGKYFVFDVADWFLSKGEMTPKKLQKMCYYAQAWCYALKGYRLEKTDFQAWVHGPVSPALWEKFKSFGYSTIKMLGYNSVSFSEEDTMILEDVWDTYGDLTGNALEILTHREWPWLEARRGYGPTERCSVIISPKTMATYYREKYIGE